MPKSTHSPSSKGEPSLSTARGNHSGGELAGRIVLATRQRILGVVLTVITLAATALAQQYDPHSFGAMKWRLIGPFRAGRVTAAVGVSSEPNTFYIGTPGGGVWKTEDAGQVWKPIFDKEFISSIGAVAVAQSKPNVVYVGTGEQIDGNGVYKSVDAGATWTNIGLNNTHKITSVLVDPHNPDIVLVAAQGEPTPSKDRGV
ncbi:MAG TPA: hypothetical protein VI756_05910, partial [Blastocatellia bacterium]